MSLTTMNTLAYDTWEPGLNMQLETEDGSLYAYLRRTGKDIFGRTTKLKLKTGRSTGIANIAEGGTFPTAGDPTYAEATITLSRIAGTVEYTLDEIDLLNGEDAAAVPVATEKMDDLGNTVRRDVIRQSWGNGLGQLCRFTASGAGVTQTIASTTTNQIDRDRFNWLEPNGMLVDAVNFTTGTAIASGTGLTISSVDKTNNTVTFNTSITPAATDGLVRSGNAFNNAGAFASREFPGIMAAVSASNTYMGINRASAGNGYWQSQVKSNATVLRPLTLDLILQLQNAVYSVTGANPSPQNYSYFANLGVWAAYGESIQPGVRYQANQTLDLGWPKLSIFNMDFFGDIHAPHNNLFLIHIPSFEYRRPKYAKRGLFQFRDEDGGVMRFVPATANYAAKYQMHMTGMLTLVTERPNRHGRVDDVTELGV